jgi:hypothetical protein
MVHNHLGDHLQTQSDGLVGISWVSQCGFGSSMSKGFQWPMFHGLIWVQQKRTLRNLKLLYDDALYLCPNDEGFRVFDAKISIECLKY